MLDNTETESMVFISFIIPCYSVQDYLPRCLDSLSSQEMTSDKEIEFILVNDGSTDNTLSLLREFEEKESRAVVIDQKNKGCPQHEMQD